MKSSSLIVTIIVMVIIAGCGTSASFMLPPNTALMINDERITFESKDDAGRPKYIRTPFFWTSIMGIEYALLQDDKVIKKDRLPSEFRIASVFWPPYALIYWPVGFRLECYDLTDIKKEIIEQCPTQDEIKKRNMNPSPESTK
jgi:hypothetical protein